MNGKTRLDRTPPILRAENWLGLGDMGGIPEFSGEISDFDSEPPLEFWISFFKALLMLYSVVPFWNVAIFGGGGKAASSGEGSAPSSTHFLSFSS